MDITPTHLFELVTRLEGLIAKLEGTSTKPDTSSPSDHPNAEYYETLALRLHELERLSADLDISSAKQVTEIILQSICFQEDIVGLAKHYNEPSKEESISICQKLVNLSKKTDTLKTTPTDTLFAEVAKNIALSSSWTFNGSDAIDVIKTYSEATEFPGNKIFLLKNESYSNWLRFLKTLLKDNVKFVETTYKKGLLWNKEGSSDFSKLSLEIGKAYRTRFVSHNTPEPGDIQKKRESIMAELKQGDARKSLKKAEVEVRKSVESKQEEVDLQEPVKKESRRVSQHKKGKKEEFNESNGIIQLENFQNEDKSFPEEQLKFRTVISLFNCSGVTIRVPKKINGVRLTNCENTTVYLESLIGSFEISNSHKTKIFVENSAQLFTIDNCEETVMHLKEPSYEAKVYVTRSTASFIRLVDSEGNETELLLPEQFFFTVNEKKQIEAKMSELYYS